MAEDRVLEQNMDINIYAKLIEKHYRQVQERREQEILQLKEEEVEVPENALYITYYINSDNFSLFLNEGAIFKSLKEFIFSKNFCECCTKREWVKWKEGYSNGFTEDDYQIRDGDVFTFYLRQES